MSLRVLRRHKALGFGAGGAAGGAGVEFGSKEEQLSNPCTSTAGTWSWWLPKTPPGAALKLVPPRLTERQEQRDRPSLGGVRRPAPGAFVPSKPHPRVPWRSVPAVDGLFVPHLLCPSRADAGALLGTVTLTASTPLCPEDGRIAAQEITCPAPRAPAAGAVPGCLSLSLWDFAAKG